MEKAFAVGQTVEEAKLPMAEFQLKEKAHDWWTIKKLHLNEPPTWQRFKDLFYEKYFPASTRDKMLGQFLSLRQGNRSVAEYEAEFNKLVKFTPEGIRDSDRAKIQKFKDGLNVELHHDVQ